MVYLFLADGFEEVEALTPVDYLRRVGLDVCCVGVGGKKVVGAHKIVVESDCVLDDVNFNLSKSMVVLPGGLKGTENLNSSERVCNVVKEVSVVGSLAAICAAPSILGRLKLLVGKKACCYPGFEKFLLGAQVVNDKVVLCENVITSKGAGTAQQFSFKMVEFLLGVESAERLIQCVQF